MKQELDFARLRRIAYTQAFKHTTNAAEAQDLVQETCLKMHRGMHTYDGRDPVPWMCRIMARLVVDAKRKRPVVQTVGLTDGDTIPDTQADAWQQLTFNELGVNLQQAVESLSPMGRSVVKMYYFECMNIDEIAEATQCDAGIVRSRLYWARKALKRQVPTLSAALA